MKIRRNSTFRKLPSITFANVLVVVVVTAAAVSISAVVAVVSYVFTYRIPQVALAQPQEQLKSSDGGAGLNLLSTKNATNSSELNTILGEPFFEDRGSKILGTEF